VKEIGVCLAIPLIVSLGLGIVIGLNILKAAMCDLTDRIEIERQERENSEKD